MTDNLADNLAKADFGNKRISADEKQSHVRALFDRVAPNYDLMNDAMSLGLHRAWKREMIQRIAPQKHELLWDAAGGTGDVALRFLSAGGGKATITDISTQMLNIGRRRAAEKGWWNNCLFLEDDMEKSSLESERFHCATCSWGLRNATSHARALAEIYRCLRFGGRFFAIEFAPPPKNGRGQHGQAQRGQAQRGQAHAALAPLAPLYQLWCSQVVPRLGAFIADDADSYRYLVESIQRFLTPQELQNAIAKAGFSNCRYELLAGGIAALYCGWKL